MGTRQIAEAFSRHRFDEAYPYLHEDVRWTLVGDRQLVGRDEVMATCAQSAAYLAGVTSTFRKVRVVVGENCVVVDCEVDYTEGVRVLPGRLLRPVRLHRRPADRDHLVHRRAGPADQRRGSMWTFGAGPQVPGTVSAVAVSARPTVAATSGRGSTAPLA